MANPSLKWSANVRALVPVWMYAVRFGDPVPNALT